jgi:hypothetical protein
MMNVKRTASIADCRLPIADLILDWKQRNAAKQFPIQTNWQLAIEIGNLVRIDKDLTKYAVPER